MKLNVIDIALTRSGLTRLGILALLEVTPAYYNLLVKGKRPLTKPMQQRVRAALMIRASELQLDDTLTELEEERELNAATSRYLLALAGRKSKS